MPERFTRVYAFQCPYCGREIKYNRNYYDKKIAELKAAITNMNSQLTEHKEDGDPGWKKRCIRAKDAMQQQLAELKSLRAEANVLVKERIDAAIINKWEWGLYTISSAAQTKLEDVFGKNLFAEVAA